MKGRIASRPNVVSLNDANNGAIARTAIASAGRSASETFDHCDKKFVTWSLGATT
jgi:hypothetical protein